MTYRVDISGLDDLIEAIEEAKKLDDVKEVVKNDTAYMANQIAEETPVRSGYLKRSETPSMLAINQLTNQVKEINEKLAEGVE